jgi:ribosomal protein S18 acetylase RimI-like enzyme
MHALDNPIWTALTTKQSTLAHSSALARRFSPEMTLLGAVAANTAMAFDSLAQLIQRDPVTLYFSAPPQFSAGWEVIRAVELHQMVFNQETQETAAPTTSAQDSSAPQVVELTTADLPEMTEIYAATRPGRSLCQRIQKLGTFVGVRDEGKLVAMGGVRLHIAGHREITTVATLPGFERRGYGTAVMRALVERIRARGERPFLTVRTDNTRAIDIYRKLGFMERTLLYSRTIRRTQA